VVLKHAKVRVGPRHAPIWFSLEDVPGAQAVRVVYGGTYAEDTGQAAAAGLMKAILSAVDALKASPSGAYTKSLEPQLIGPGISKATARRALEVIRGKKPWPAGSLAGKTQPIVTEDRHGRAVFLVLDVAQAEQIGLGDQESGDE